jgi:hypothetical protein
MFVAILMRASVTTMNIGSKRQSTWTRRTLLSILGYEGLGGLVGGTLLIASPDGSLMDMPVDILHGRFPNFLVPGIILTAMGLITVFAFFAVMKRARYDWVASYTALWGYTIWFIVEIVILEELHWLHAMWGIPVLLGLGVSVPLLPLRSISLRGLKLLLACGALSSLFYALVNVIVGTQWPAYDAPSKRSANSQR